ncbi:hypothetical protein DDD_2635 [Nonlabens dokdonensis DSW-6]|uniref:Uncharacterized protein n=1 Tax=Nonlabens dokdonensis (strain DSM 17205 / KCTC 12402 / DSW-6) TaxID=592029 RepID=L7WC28_NONDD|nr:hypothetical protein DDD_2635 [Nonlabens dokdonensis DSW-6]
MAKENSKKWNRFYALVIAANVVFAILFYILSSVYGNS